MIAMMIPINQYSRLQYLRISGWKVERNQRTSTCVKWFSRVLIGYMYAEQKCNTSLFWVARPQAKMCRSIYWPDGFLNGGNSFGVTLQLAFKRQFRKL